MADIGSALAGITPRAAQDQNQERAQSNVGAGVVGGVVAEGLLAKVVNDDAGILIQRGVLGFFASKPAPT
jgi:hypothetical protein